MAEMDEILFSPAHLPRAGIYCQKVEMPDSCDMPGPRCSATLTLVKDAEGGQEDLLYLIGGGHLVLQDQGEGGAVAVDEAGGAVPVFRHYDTVHVLRLRTGAALGWHQVQTQGPARMPARRGHSACLWDRHEDDDQQGGGRVQRRSIVVFGGVGDDEVLRDDVWELQLETHTWQQLHCSFENPALSGPLAARGHLATIHDDTYIIMGGQRGDYPSNLYNLELCLRSRQWRVVVVDPPHPAFVFRSTMGFCAHAFVQDPQPRLLCWPSAGDEVISVTLHDYKWHRIAPTLVGPPPPAAAEQPPSSSSSSPSSGGARAWGRFCPSSCGVGGEGSGMLLAFGGTSKANHDTNDLFLLRVERRDDGGGGGGAEEEEDPPTGQGQERATIFRRRLMAADKGGGQLPCPRNAGSMVSYGTSVLLFGGGCYGQQSYYNDLHVLTFALDPALLPPRLKPAPPPLHLLPLLPPASTVGGPARLLCSSSSSSTAAASSDGSAAAQAEEEEEDAVTLYVREAGGGEEEEVVVCRVGRAALASLSPVLSAWVAGPFREAGCQRVRLPTELISRQTWQEFLLRYAPWPSRWHPTANSSSSKGEGEEEGGGLQGVVDLLRLADVYELPHLRRECERTLLMMILGTARSDHHDNDDDEVSCPSEQLDLLSLATSLSAGALRDHCLHRLLLAWHRAGRPPASEFMASSSSLAAAPGGSEEEEEAMEVEEGARALLEAAMGRQAGLTLQHKVRWIANTNTSAIAAPPTPPGP